MVKSLLILLSLIVLFAKISSAHARCDDGEKEIRFGLPVSIVETPQTRLARQIQVQFQRALNGRYCIKIYRDAGFANDGGLAALKLGTAELVAPSFSELAPTFPRYGLFSRSFAFEDEFGLEKFFKAEFSNDDRKKDWEKGYGALGATPFGMAFFGFMQLAAKQPVFLPQNAVGLKFLTQNNRPSLELLNLLKATGRPFAANEQSAAIKDGRVEAQFSDWRSLSSTGAGLSHAALIEMNFNPDGAQVLGSTKWQRSIDIRPRLEINKAIETGIVNFNIAERKDQTDAKRLLMQRGAPVYTLTRQQRGEWKKHLKPLTDETSGSKVIKRLQNAAGKTN